ncbi:hypothetical protein TRICI_001276 [Trichomonascus ciferrii]|uniref:Uncharacterized protein n=1 Tax=Trichomonascus ciferrii TaxID=44093 RepID=A0A642V938_9ASCO|nr:hypothetical protein TRICI_001276 [Trichomonascus ciferrii]
MDNAVLRPMTEFGPIATKILIRAFPGSVFTEEVYDLFRRLTGSSPVVADTEFFEWVNTETGRKVFQKVAYAELSYIGDPEVPEGVFLKMMDLLGLKKLGQQIYIKTKAEMTQGMLDSTGMVGKAENPEGSNCFRVPYCKTGCIAYYGVYGSMDKCFVCHEPRDEFTYVTYVSPREFLRNLYLDENLAKAMKQRSWLKEDGYYRDVWRGGYIEQLKETEIETESCTGTKYKSTKFYFEDDRELAISLHSDGCRESLTALYLIVHNLSPKDRVMVENTPILMVIPRLENDSGSASFWWPLIDDFAELSASGINAYDADTKEYFRLKAHVTFLTGSWVAVSRMMGIDETHPTHPCRTCVQQMTSIENLKGITKSKSTYQEAETLHGLPYTKSGATIRTLDHYTERASLIKLARTPEIASKVKDCVGFRHVSPFLNLNSVQFPDCCPIDSIYDLCCFVFRYLLRLLVYENAACSLVDEDRDVVCRMFDIWSSKEEGMSSMEETLQFDTLPQLGSPITIVEGFLAIYYEINVLRRRGHKLVNLVMELSRLILILVSGKEISPSQLKMIDAALNRFLEQYEECLYIDESHSAIQFLTTPIHMLKHVKHCIQETGLPTLHTSYQTENQCKTLKSMVSNDAYPLKSIGPLLLWKYTGTIVSPLQHSYRPLPHLKPQEFIGFIEVLKPELAQVVINFINKYLQEMSNVWSHISFQPMAHNKINPGSCTKVFGAATLPDDYARTSMSQVGIESPIIYVPQTDGHGYAATIECMIRSSNIADGPLFGTVSESKSCELEFLLVRKLQTLADVEIDSTVIAPGTRISMGTIYYPPKQYQSPNYQAVFAKDIEIVDQLPALKKGIILTGSSYIPQIENSL